MENKPVKYINNKKINMKKLYYCLNKDYVYLDNAASTPVFKNVKKDTDKFLKTYGSIHRGAGPYSKISTDKYEEARSTIEEFIGAKKGRDVVIFSGNTTEAINKMAQIFPFKENDVLLTSDIEHSSNLLPWQKYVKVERFKTDEYYRITPEEIEERLKNNSKIVMVAVSGASNLTGLIAPIKEIYKVCKKYNVFLFIDASQMSSHYPICLDDCDFIALSGHKMYAPFGCGVLAGRKEVLENTGLGATGGGNVCYVHEEKGPIYKQAPWKHEPGTPNGIGAVAIASAAKTIMSIGWDNIIEHNKQVSRWIIDTFDKIDGVNLIFPNKKLVEQGVIHTPIAVFDVIDKDNNDVAEILGKNNIAVRAGTFCLYNLVERVMNISPEEKDFVYKENCNSKSCNLPENYTLIRASGGLMTEKKDYEKLVNILNKNIKIFKNKHKKELNSYHFLKNLPITINNYYGDPVLQWDNTIDKLKKLSIDEHLGPVSIITKGYIDEEKAKTLKDVTKNLNFLVLVSISELPKEIEPVGQEHRYKTIENLLTNGIKVLGYVRPFMPGYNDNEQTIDKIFKNIKNAGCKTIVVSGFRGDDNILLKTDIKEKEKWVVRVKQMPKGIAEIIERKAKEYELEIFNRTSCGVSRVLGQEKTYNPYYNSPIGAGCDTCSMKEKCHHCEPSNESLEFIKKLGYDIEYIPEGNEKCKITPDKRLSCLSCCTTCFMLKVPHILVKNENITLGDLAFIRFITGVLACKPGVVDNGNSTVGNITFPNIKVPYQIQCLNTWFEYATQTDNCFRCKYCIVPIYELENKDYGCTPKELSEYIDKELNKNDFCRW